MLREHEHPELQGGIEKMSCKYAWLLLLLPAITIVNPAYGDSRIDAVLASYIEWRGGVQALENLASVSQYGTLSVAGLQGAITLQQRREGDIYQSFDLGVFKGTEVMTSEDSWAINSSGQLEDLGISRQQDLARTLQDSFAEIVLGTSGLHGERLQPEKRDGNPYDIIRFTYENGDHFDMFIDQNTGAHYWTRNVTDGKTVWHKLSDWHMVGELRFPFHEQELHEDAAENSEITWHNIVVNDALDSSLFVHPQPSVDGAGIANGSSTRWLPMDTYLDRYIFIRGNVNGHATDIVLDSGAGMSVLDKSFAERAGIQGQGELQAHGASGSMAASLTDGISINIDSLHLNNLTGAILDLGDISSGLGRDVPVILGKEIFNRFVVDIDYPRGRIAFRNYDDFAYPGAGRPLQLYPGDDGHKLLDIEIENYPSARVTLDTGSGQTLTLFRAYWDHTHRLLDDGRSVSDIRTGGVGGENVSMLSSLKSVRIADYKLDNVPVELYTGKAGSFNTKRLAGNLGAGILNRFRVIFDYSRDRLILEPSAGFTDGPFRKDRVGLQLKKTQAGLTVAHVAKGSPAKKAGWKEGDVLYAVNGESIETHYREQWQELSTAAIGTHLELTNDKRITTTIDLADYY
jgi:hypothetical protein